MALTLSKYQLRGISSLFSRRVFSGIMQDDVSLLDMLVKTYLPYINEGVSLFDIFKSSYSYLAKSYRCEYVYKNELLNQKLLKEYGTKHTLAINEFRVGNSIADIAMFNGESKAFEIKSDLDSAQRLPSQMFDYTRLFQKCYVVIPEESLNSYVNGIGYGIGIIVMTRVKRHLELVEYRKAEPNYNIDSDLVMSCLHTKEYMHLIKTYYGSLPNVSIFDMFKECKNMMRSIPPDILQVLFLKEIESRASATSRLRLVPKELRQMCLCMNMDNNDISSLNRQLSKTIN